MRRLSWIVLSAFTFFVTPAIATDTFQHFCKVDSTSESCSFTDTIKKKKGNGDERKAIVKLGCGTSESNVTAPKSTLVSGVNKKVECSEINTDEGGFAVWDCFNNTKEEQTLTSGVSCNS